MIDEKARAIALWAWDRTKSGLALVADTASRLARVYLDRVRWIELTASCGGAAALAAQAMAYMGAPKAEKAAAICAALWTAWVYLRNPKMASWQDKAAPEASDEN